MVGVKHDISTTKAATSALIQASLEFFQGHAYELPSVVDNGSESLNQAQQSRFEFLFKWLIEQDGGFEYLNHQKYRVQLIVCLQGLSSFIALCSAPAIATQCQ